jgi:hypothetical protein
MDLERSQAVRGLAGRRLRFDIAAEREGDGLSVSVERPRARDLARTGQSLKGALWNPQRFAQIIKGRLAEGDVEPVEASLRAQCGDAFSLGSVEPVEDLRHGPSDSARTGATRRGGTNKREGAPLAVWTGFPLVELRIGEAPDR